MMRELADALWIEMLKARRSKVPLLTALGFLLMPLGIGFFMVILKNPDLGRRLGLLGAKAQLSIGAADWPTFLMLMPLIVAAGGLVVFAFIASWIFGREFADGTAKDLLALPTPRSTIVAAKFIVLLSWSILLILLVVVVSFAVGAVVVLPKWSAATALASLFRMLVGGILSIALVTMVAFVASAGRGYLPPIGFAIVTLVLAQFLGQTGWAPYFPWSVPAIFVYAAGPQAPRAGPISYLLVMLTSAAGIALTVAWWRRADQAR